MRPLSKKTHYQRVDTTSAVLRPRWLVPPKRCSFVHAKLPEFHSLPPHSQHSESSKLLLLTQLSSPWIRLRPNLSFVMFLTWKAVVRSTMIQYVQSQNCCHNLSGPFRSTHTRPGQDHIGLSNKKNGITVDLNRPRCQAHPTRWFRISKRATPKTKLKTTPWRRMVIWSWKTLPILKECS